MNYRLLVPVLLGLGLGAVLPAAQADMPPNYQGSTIDLTDYLPQRSDAQSQSFGFDGWNEHKFTITKSGRYLIESASRAGMSDRYRIEAKLLDEQGNVVAESEALGVKGGLHMTPELQPGDYTLRVNAREFGKSELKGNRYTVSVTGLNGQGERLSETQSGVSGGDGVNFNRDAEGPTTAFVSSPDASAALAAPAMAGGAGNSSSATNAKPQVSTKAGSMQSEQPSAPKQAQTSKAQAEQASKRFKEIVTDVDMNMKGKALSFDVVEPGTISISTSTMIGTQGTYRIEARVLDSDGNVVASDEGTRFAGNVHIEKVLQPGHYTIWVKGHRYGNSQDSANNYALRVKQLDTR